MSIMPPLKSFFATLKDDTPELYGQFVGFIQRNGINKAAKKYAKEWNRSEDTIRKQYYGALTNPNMFWFAVDVLGEEEARKKQAVNYDEKPIREKAVVKGNQITIQKTAQAPLAVQPDKEPGTLSEEETLLLDKFRSGDIGFDRMQHELAYRLFKKILQYPELIKVSDWLKSEVIKIQREEISLKKEQMERSWALLLGGFEFPKHCPHCGFDLQPKAMNPIDPAFEGEIVNEENGNDSESVDTSGSI